MQGDELLPGRKNIVDCRARLRARNASGTHDYAASDAEFDLITSHFVAPTPEEGFTVIVHRDAQVPPHRPLNSGA